jgi:UDP-N-acetylglucosamine/UDP-N-acetylgalactosamine diphosphorylase
VVRKTDPVESVGVVAVRDGAYGVVEYSEISKADAERRDAQGQLSLRAANIANHFYTLEFLNEVLKFETKMAYHIANKNIDSVDESGKAAATKVAGMKMELFVFDVFPFTNKDRFKVFEVVREDEFSPLKNKSGSDSPETSRKDLLNQHRKWLKVVGVEVVEGAEVEVSPLVSYAGEGLDTPGKASRKYEKTTVLERE